MRMSQSLIQLLAVCAITELFVLLMGQISTREELRCVSTMFGELSAMTRGAQQMPHWSANSWDMLILQVSASVQ